MPGAVRADQRDALAALDGEPGVGDERAARDLDDQLLGLDHDAPAPRRRREAEPERALLGRPLDPLDPRDRLQLALRLAGVRAVAEPVDEPLEVRHLLLLALERPRLGGDPLGLHAAPVRVGALLVAPAAAVDLEHAGRDRLEEPAVVRHEHDAGVEPGELVLEPLDGVGVEVVGRLVEEQHVRARRPARATSEARVSSPPENVRSGRSRSAGEKPSPRATASSRVAPRVAARPLELALGGVVAAQDGVGRVLGHPRLELAQLGLELLGRGPGADVRPERVGRRRAAGAGRAAPRACPAASRCRPGRARARRRAGAGASSCRRRFGRRARSGRAAG